jgi:hypothetical protein
MTAESLSLFYEEQRTTRAESRGPGLDLAHPYADHRGPSTRPAPAPELVPGQLVRWTDEGGCPHVGRVESTTDGIVSVAYGPRPHRETCPADELTPITDKDGEGRLR